MTEKQAKKIAVECIVGRPWVISESLEQCCMGLGLFCNLSTILRHIRLVYDILQTDAI